MNKRKYQKQDNQQPFAKAIAKVKAGLTMEKIVMNRPRNCDYCNKVAKFQSINTHEFENHATLERITGEPLGLIKIDPQSKSGLVFYCEDHMPTIEQRKVLWMKGYASTGQIVLKNFEHIAGEWPRAVQSIHKRTGAVLTLEYLGVKDTLAVAPQDMKPIFDAVQNIYENASVRVMENNKMVSEIGFSPVDVESVIENIQEIWKQVSFYSENSGGQESLTPLRTIFEEQFSIIVRSGDQTVKTFAVSKKAVRPIIDGIFLVFRRATITMQHGEEKFEIAFHPRDTKQVVDAIIEICNAKQ